MLGGCTQSKVPCSFLYITLPLCQLPPSAWCVRKGRCIRQFELGTGKLSHHFLRGVTGVLSFYTWRKDPGVESQEIHHPILRVCGFYLSKKEDHCKGPNSRVRKTWILIPVIALPTVWPWAICLTLQIHRFFIYKMDYPSHSAVVLLKESSLFKAPSTTPDML